MSRPLASPATPLATAAVTEVTAAAPGDGRASAVRTIARSFRRRAIDLVAVLVIVVVVTSAVARLVPGSPAVAILGPDATPGAVRDLDQQLGINKPIWSQIWTELFHYLQGNLGTSLTQAGTSVSSIVRSALPITLTVVVLGIVVGLLIGVPIGLITGASTRRSVGRITSIGTSILIAIPPFATGSLLLLLVAQKLGLAPAGGWGTGPLNDLYYAWLPAVTLGLLLVTPVVRTVHRSAREAARSEYVDAARSRGVSERRILYRHLLPVAALPLITLIGFSASVLLGGAIILESIFGLPGFGQAVSNAVLSRDYPTVAGLTVVAAVIVVCINILADVASSLLDPRVRLSR
jgi:peptide/nickel transport system permease protein